MSSFIHLKIHSEYSLIDSIIDIDTLIRTAAENKIPAVAITDRVNLFGLVKFYKKALEFGIKPIIGSDLILKGDKEFFLVTALCKNQKGYANLRELISKAYLQGQINSIPTIEWDWLTQHPEGLIILSGGRHGDIGKAILSDDKKLAEKRLKNWMHYFSTDFYLELQRTNREGEENYIQSAIVLAEKFSVPVVATNDVRFMKSDDFEAHETRVCIQSSRVLNDSKRPKNYSDQQYFKTATEMAELFSDIPESLQNTVEIAKRCTVELKLGQAYLPQFPLPSNVDLKEYFENKAREGLRKRLASTPTSTPTLYEDRLAFELNVIHNMGFSGYFLIVADFIQWSKDNAIPVGPGRGSGAGSLVAYSLGITGLDPIEHELLFERFLNPERVSMPDFDIDFCMDNRDRVIEYVADKYGRDAVSQIITYGTMAAKAVVRDVGRVMGFPYGFVDKIAKLIPFEIGITLEKALEQEVELAKLYNTEEEVKNLIDLAKKLEGLARNAGKHAGGVVIAPTKLTDFAPLYCEAESDHIVTQFDKDDVEAVGLVKFDFLGLRTLTIIQWAVNSINTHTHTLNIDTIPLNDPKTFSLLKSCATTAVFQLESRGMKDLVRRLQPDCFDEITALVALFRPGPLQSGMVDDFINRKHGREKVHYFHPDIEPILKPTYGVILYQEQVMQIAQVLSGYSLGAADLLRRAMGKKKPEEMAKLRETFISGAKNRGVDEKTSAHIFDVIEKFAGYGFNKSHSAAYALLAYQTAYLKAHYPAEFMAAVLSSDMDNTDKVVSFYHECQAMHLKMLSPNINISDYPFSVNEKGEIKYGLGAIKGVGEAAAKHIITEREKNGSYKNLFDFCERLNLHTVSRRAIEPLIYSGAMDVFGVNRETLFDSIDKAIKNAEQKHKTQAVGQVDLFGSDADVSEAHIIKENPLKKLENEKAVLGHYLSGHPIKIYENEITRLTTCVISGLSAHMGKSIVIAGLLIGIKKIITKQGKRMAIVTFEDRTGVVEITLFSKLFDEVSPYLEKNQVYIVHGKVEEDSFNQNVRMLAESIDHLDMKRAKLAKRLVIFVESEKHVEKLLADLPSIMQPYQGGDCPIHVFYKNNDAKANIELGKEWSVHPKNNLLAQLKQLYGEEAVKVGY
ncbi:MAG: DNA polymerase III subunit alpha [Gammaproteobacteria bacterium RIFCSPHIGHO2_02_FULL_39_13]|nr:MAG: DNA polymerase III subunit alpha [Gammaproteobacteria bacterium RIFCSPHIGHO2_02_FULL_39_13]OGT50432.1 MAG: DNA polymerase III subunit alpha [Gammaproteobacteria bacterium RIFCSPHIGHO2_12_FULL_39_24]